MKPLPLILAASLVANAAFVTVSLRSSSAADAASGKNSARADTEGKAKKSGAASAGANVKLPDELIDALNGNDVEALRDLLRSAGLSEDLIRSIVQMRIWKNYEARFKALQPQQASDATWWKDDRNQQNRWGGGMTKDQREQMRALQKEIREQTEKLLGPEANPARGWQDQRLAFLPAEKRQSLQEIQQDYQELMSEVQQDMQGFRLPSDTEKLKFLQEEQKRDIEAIMTPEERQAYELRMSGTAQQLRWKMTQFDASEAEYLAIFPLQKAFDDKYNQNANDPFGPYQQPERDQNYWKQRNDDEKALQDQIKSMIGEERYTESIRRQDNDYQQLEAATRRLALPADTPSKVFALRDNVAATAHQIAENTNLASDQKKQALVDLANATRDQIRASLGSEGADAYLKNNMGWVKELERGNTITFNKDSTGWSTKALPRDPKKTATK